MNLYCLLCYLFIGFNNNYMSSLDRLNHYTTDEKKDKKVNLNDLLERLEIEKKKRTKKKFSFNYCCNISDSSFWACSNSLNYQVYQ